jgi:hypothetical protein
VDVDPKDERDRIIQHSRGVLAVALGGVGFLFFAFVVLLVVVALSGREDADREQYVRENLELLGEVPVFRGARPLGLYSRPWRLQPEPVGASFIAGYKTIASYEAPAHTRPGEVARFYRASLLGAGWRRKSWQFIPTGWPHDLSGDTGVVNTCYGGIASICLNLLGMLNEGRVFTVSVDYRAYEGRPL